MGLIIEELRDRKPELPYFDEAYTGEYPSEPHLRYQSLNRYIRRQVLSLRKMKNSLREHTNPHLSFRAGTEHAQQYGSIL